MRFPVGGGSLPAVRVELNPSQLFKSGVSLDSVRKAISDANVLRPQASVSDNERRWQIDNNSELKTADDYRPLIVHYNDGAAVRLADVATVKDSVQNVRAAGMSNGKPAILLVIRRSRCHIIATVARIREQLPVLQDTIPASVDLQVAGIAHPPSAPH